jgi:hypothetical protein
VIRRLGLALLLALAAGPAVAATPKPVLPFITDDYDRALEVARQQQLPLFIESWAPW